MTKIASACALFVCCTALSLSACSAEKNGSPAESASAQPIACGSAELYLSTHTDCGAMQAEGAPSKDGTNCLCLIGYKWDGSACVSLNGCACSGPDCDKLAETEAQCQAEHAACSAPEPESIACGSAALTASDHGSCDAMDVQAVPDEGGNACFCSLGYAWNGASCELLGNCACAGSDCDKLTATAEECQALHSACGAD